MHWQPTIECIHLSGESLAQVFDECLPYQADEHQTDKGDAL